MNVYKDLNALPNFQNAVITIGSFDGVHQGHQIILQRVLGLAKKVNGESVVITFHPHPRQVIYPKDNTLQLLTTIEEKTALIERYGIDNLVIVPFTVAFSQQSADEYIEKFLIGRFNPRWIVIGYDHRFGLNRQGDIHYLKHYSRQAGFEVDEIEPQQINAITISSTKIRIAIQQGRIMEANKLLNHTYQFTGTVVHGRQVGQSIGFPTANLHVNNYHKLLPPVGIYAVWVYHRGLRYGGMLYIGNRPSIEDDNQISIEVNIFDFNQNIYGDQLQLELVDFVREDAIFSSLDELKVALANDKKKTLAILKKHPLPSLSRTIDHYPEVAVVILNFNGSRFLKDFLPAVQATTYPNTRIIVADNGSTDDSMDVLQQHFSPVEILDLKKNYGFAGGYNEALRQVKSPYYVLLNSDVAVTPEWLTPILEWMEEDETIGAAQPKIRSFHQKDHFEYAGAAGGWLDYLGYPFCRGRVLSHCEKDDGQYDEPQEIFWATGAAMVIRSEVFHNLGGLDATYFAHMEEIDLCWRIKRAGYKVVVQPRSVVYHVGGGTLSYNTPRKTYLNFRNSLTTLLKNEPSAKLWWLIPYRLILDGIAGGLFLVQGRMAHIWQIIRAHGYFYANFNRILRQRRLLNQLVEEHRIGMANQKGHFPKSILWRFYLLGKKTFREITGEKPVS